MKKIILTLSLGIFAFTLSAQSVFTADQITAMMLAKKEVRLQNAVIEGDIDLSSVGSTDTTANYQYKNKQYYVITTWVNAPIVCTNCVFKGKFVLFHEEKNAKGEIIEYRTEFKSGVAFKNCVFEGEANLQLANFDASFSLAYTVFKKDVDASRIGLAEPILLESSVFEQGVKYRNTQDEKLEKLTAAQLKQRIGKQSSTH